MIILNSFRCYATEAFSAIFKLNNFFIRCTLLFADGLSYMPDKASIRFVVVFSFTTLCATDLDRVNLITPSTCLSRRAYSSAFIASSFVPKRGRCNFLPWRQSSICILQYANSVPSNFFYSRHLSCFLCHCSHSNLTIGSDTSCRELT